MENFGITYSDSQVEDFKISNWKRYRTVDDDCLKEYNQDNEHFSMEAVTINEEGNEKFTGYNCIYRYGKFEVKLECNVSNGTWTLIPNEDRSKDEEKELTRSIAFVNQYIRIDMGYILDEQIKNIIKYFDRFFEFRQENEEKEETKIALESWVVPEVETEVNVTEDEIKESSPNEGSESIVILQDNELKPEEELKLEEELNPSNQDVTYDIPHSSINDSDSKSFDAVLVEAPPADASCNGENSLCNKQSDGDGGYDSFNPPAEGPRRVIQSIHLNVEQKAKFFDKIFNCLKRTKPTSMDDLGLEFLRVYDGKFNYSEGHKFVMPFQKKIWDLIIDQIKCVDCPEGENEPRSELILHYNGEYTTVRV